MASNRTDVTRSHNELQTTVYYRGLVTVALAASALGSWWIVRMYFEAGRYFLPTQTITLVGLVAAWFAVAGIVAVARRQWTRVRLSLALALAIELPLVLMTVVRDGSLQGDPGALFGGNFTSPSVYNPSIGLSWWATLTAIPLLIAALVLDRVMRSRLGARDGGASARLRRRSARNASGWWGVAPFVVVGILLLTRFESVNTTLEFPATWNEVTVSYEPSSITVLEDGTATLVNVPVAEPGEACDTSATRRVSGAASWRFVGEGVMRFDIGPDNVDVVAVTKFAHTSWASILLLTCGREAEGIRPQYG